MLKSQLAAAPAPDLGGFKTELVQSLTQNLQTYESDEGYQIAHVLDPRYKGVCIPEGQLEVIKETLTTLLAGDQAPAPPVPIAPPAPQPPLQGEAALFAQLLGARLNEQAAEPPVPQPVLNPAVRQFQDYLSTPREADLSLDVLLWWKQRPQFALLFPTVRKFLSKPYTSAESERTFSATGRIYTPKRTLLGAMVANMLVVSKALMPVFGYKFDYPEEVM